MLLLLRPPTRPPAAPARPPAPAPLCNPRSYEKKRGSESFWAPYIKELGNQQARGPQGAKSPLLWPEHQVGAGRGGRGVAGRAAGGADGGRGRAHVWV